MRQPSLFWAKLDRASTCSASSPTMMQVPPCVSATCFTWMRQIRKLLRGRSSMKKCCRTIGYCNKNRLCNVACHGVAWHSQMLLSFGQGHVLPLTCRDLLFCTAASGQPMCFSLRRRTSRRLMCARTAACTARAVAQAL